MGCLEGNVGYQGDVCCHKGTVWRQEGLCGVMRGMYGVRKEVGVRGNVRCHEGTVGRQEGLWGVRRRLYGVRKEL